MLYMSPWKCDQCKQNQPGNISNCLGCKADRPPCLRDPRTKGLGGTIKAITTTVGIKPCAGCNWRADLVDKVFPYKKKP